MQKLKKHELKKLSKAKEQFFQEHSGEGAEILYECYRDLDNLVNRYTNALHAKLFSEEYDFMGDSIADSRDRARGTNPMSDEYENKVNQKRISMGFLPLKKDGMPSDANKTKAYCREKILVLLCQKH